MERLQTITHKGKQIYYVDLSGFNSKAKSELKEYVDAAMAHIEQQPAKSLLILSNFEGMRFDGDMIEMFRAYAEHNTPYIKASALIGIDGLQKVAMNLIRRFTDRELHLFDNQQKAIDWLVEQ